MIFVSAWVRNSEAEYSALNGRVEISKFSGPTIKLYGHTVTLEIKGMQLPSNFIYASVAQRLAAADF